MAASGRPRRFSPRRLMTVSLASLTLLLSVVAVHGQKPFVPNGAHFPNEAGTAATYSTTGDIDLTNPFFQSLGSNGRSCGTCHQPGDGMSVSAAHIQQRFDSTNGLDPIFRKVDGSTCDHGIDVSTVAGRSAAYSLLRTRGLFRIGISVPATADFDVVSVDNPYLCNETGSISMYRRPLPAANLPFLSAVMFDGRESTPATGTTKILFNNYPTSLRSDLAHQSLDATIGHAQGDGTRPTPAEREQIVNFETSLFTAQITSNNVDRLDAGGANGGPVPLSRQPFFISINSSVNVLLPQLEQPGGLVTPGDGHFTPRIFDIFDAWADLPPSSSRAAVARGQELFNSKPIVITGVKGINDDVNAGGLVPGGMPSLQGTCGTCHDTPNVGNHSFPTPLNIGVGDPSPSDASLNVGGLDIAYLPRIRVCRKDAATGQPTSDCIITTDLGQALVDGKFDHAGKVKGPVLRGLSARAPYFHNGSARTLMDVVRFYEVRFGLVLTSQEENDLVAFLSAL
jgi:cytochrome c peroxidase